MRATTRFTRLFSAACTAIAVAGTGFIALGGAGAPAVSVAAAPAALAAAGDLGYFGSAAGRPLASPVVWIAPTPTSGGYWLAASDGGVFNYGNAPFLGSAGDMHLAAPVAALVPTPSGLGYWLVGADGGVLGFGDAPFIGSGVGHVIGDRIVAAASSPSGRGLFLAGAHGTLITLGDAQYQGTFIGGPPSGDVVGIVSDHATGGYWMATSGGGVYAFGAAPFRGSAGAARLAAPITAMAGAADGDGYWLVARDGGVFSYGSATYHGSAAGFPLAAPIVGAAAAPSGQGYWAVAADGGVLNFPGPPLGPFAYVATQNGTPVRFNPCQPVSVRVNTSHMPAGGMSDLQTALGDVEQATGLSISITGTTGEIPVSSRGTTNPGYGPGFAPVVVDWALPGETDFPLGPSNLGWGGPRWVLNAQGQAVSVTGAVVINAAAGLPAGFGAGETDGKVLLHELGHVFGLADIAAPTQVMNIDPGAGPGTWGSGDLAGLARLGVGAGCLAEPTPGT